jgi:hypothetical protein
MVKVLFIKAKMIVNVNDAVKFWFLFLAFCGVFTGSMRGAEAKSEPAWLSSVTRAKPGKFVAVQPSEASYRIGWSGFTAGYGVMRFSRPKPGLSQLAVEGGTSGFVRGLFLCDAQGFSVCEKNSLRSIRSRQAVRYRKGTSLSVIEFGKKEVLAAKGGVPAEPPLDFFADTPADASRIQVLTGKEPKRFEYSPVFDVQSAFLYVRSQPLNEGDVFKLVVIQENTAYLATVTVLGRESVAVPAGKFPAIKLGLSMQKVDKRGNLKPYSRLRRAQGWMTDDENRLLAKVETEVFVGSVWAALEKVEPLNANGS